MKRFHYIITAMNSTRIDEGSSFRIASDQIRARDMNHALERTMKIENIIVKQNPNMTLCKFHAFYRNDRRVGVFISPEADDMES